jgi:lysophospholipase L1-like esterase
MKALRGFTMTALVVSMLPAAAGQNASVQAPSILQPGALVPMFEDLYRLTSAGSSIPIHILQFGDSHTAADEWTGRLRSLLKDRFGDGGSGFSPVAQPFRGFRRFDVQGGGTSGWQPEGLRPGLGDGYLGLSGIASSTRLRDQSVFIETECDRLEIQFLRQPAGGDVALYDYDQLIGRFSTEGELGPGFMDYDTAPGLHRFLLRTLTSRPVRLFGWVGDKRKGITYEATGINGVEASSILHWNEATFATYLRRRNPGLVVLEYGTNEAANEALSREKYRSIFSEVLRRFRRAAPGSAILVLGPPDSWSNRDGKWQPLPSIERVITAQKAASRDNGCVFWDTRQRMGGPGSMRDWVNSGMAQRDYIHFTSSGYHRLAAMLFDDLMKLYGMYVKVRLQIVDS